MIEKGNTRQADNILISISQGKMFEIVDKPTEYRYHLEAPIDTDKTMKLFTESIVNILESLSEPLNIGEIKLEPGFEIVSDNYITPIIDVVSVNRIITISQRESVYEILSAYVSRVAIVIHPNDYVYGPARYSDSEIQRFIEEEANEFLAKRCESSIKHPISLDIGNHLLDFGGKWQEPNQVCVNTTNIVLEGVIDQLGKIKNKFFTILDNDGRVFKVSYDPKLFFRDLHQIHGKDEPHLFTIEKQIYNVVGQYSLDLQAIDRYEEIEHLCLVQTADIIENRLSPLDRLVSHGVSQRKNDKSNVHKGVKV